MILVLLLLSFEKNYFFIFFSFLYMFWLFFLYMELFKFLEFLLTLIIIIYWNLFLIVIVEFLLKTIKLKSQI